MYQSTHTQETPTYPGFVYLLELQGGRYYVGYTANLTRRLEQHYSGEGSIATRQYAPVRTMLTRPGNLRLEKSIYEACRDRWGSGKVRGAYHCERFHCWE